MVVFEEKRGPLRPIPAVATKEEHMSGNHMKWLVAIVVTGAATTLALGSAWADGRISTSAAKDGGAAFELAAKDGGGLVQLGAKEAGVELAAKDGGGSAFELAAKDAAVLEQQR
jgi:hypothetical protein